MTLQKIKYKISLLMALPPHVVLSISLAGSYPLYVTFYNADNTPYSPIGAFRATGSLIVNGEFQQNIIVAMTSFSFLGSRPTVCGTRYTVIFDNIEIDGTPLPGFTETQDTIIFSNDTVIYNGFITQIPNQESTTLSAFIPPAVTLDPATIKWYHNYRILSEGETSITVSNNGVYELEFRNSGITYKAIAHVTRSKPIPYLLIEGSDENIYGVTGTFKSSKILRITPRNFTSRSQQTFVNDLYYSAIPFINISNLTDNSTIRFLVRDCCDNMITASTYVIPCTIN